MFKNYFKIAWRNLKRNKGYALINIGGLAVGLACCIFIGFYVQHELSFDNFNEKADRIYRVLQYTQMGAKSEVDLEHSARLGPALEKEFPGVEAAVRLSQRWGSDVLVQHGKNTFYENAFYFVDPEFFNVFSFPLIRGNQKTALSKPFSIVLTQEIAKKYFGNKNPIGRTIEAKGYGKMYKFTVTGVAKNPPSNTHIQFDALVSFSTLRFSMPSPEHLDSWRYVAHYTYVLLKDGFTPAEFQSKLEPFIAKYHSRTYKAVQKMGDAAFGYRLQPITRIHLYSHYERELSPNSDIKYIYIFSLLALLILVVACINYINLATTRYSYRANEVGMRKVVGAHRGQLIQQFLSESALVCFVALIAAYILVKLFLPPFSAFSGISFQVDIFSWSYLAGLFCFGVILVMLTGSYPAFYLSRFQPSKILKSNRQTNTSGAGIRKGLVVFQFAVAIVLIIGTFFILRQFKYMQNMRLGFNKEHVVVVHARDELADDYKSFKQSLLNYIKIKGVTSSSILIPAKKAHAAYLVPEGVDKKIWSSQSDITINIMAADKDFPQVMEIPVLEGIGLQTMTETKDFMPVLINETAARKLGWDNPIGKTFPCCWSPAPRVVGVVSDFHYQTLKSSIQPLVIRKSNYSPNFVLIRVFSNDLSGTISFIQKQWNKISDTPFNYTFLDQRFDELYRSELRFARIFSVFTVLAIFIACLGLFGLAAFTAEHRTKEIGIRKVMGATVVNIAGLLSKDFLKLVLIGFVIAVPVALYFMNQWLQDFAYRIDIGAGVFLLAGGLALLIALATVSWQSIRAALANPVDSLRSE